VTELRIDIIWITPLARFDEIR